MISCGSLFSLSIKKSIVFHGKIGYNKDIRMGNKTKREKREW